MLPRRMGCLPGGRVPSAHVLCWERRDMMRGGPPRLRPRTPPTTDFSCVWLTHYAASLEFARLGVGCGLGELEAGADDGMKPRERKRGG